MKITYFLEERRIYRKVLGNNIQAEQMAVNACTSHGKTI